MMFPRILSAPLQQQQKNRVHNPSVCLTLKQRIMGNVVWSAVYNK